jgi:hypothetical protein
MNIFCAFAFHAKLSCVLSLAFGTWIPPISEQNSCLSDHEVPQPRSLRWINEPFLDELGPWVGRYHEAGGKL